MQRALSEDMEMYYLEQHGDRVCGIRNRNLFNFLKTGANYGPWAKARLNVYL